MPWIYIKVFLASLYILFFTATFAQNQKTKSSGPERTFLNTKPKPQVVTVPKSKEGSYVLQTLNGPQTIKLESPKVHLLPISPSLSNEKEKVIHPETQGKGFFTTYTTDNGLALDAILCSIMDKEGNLWFSTAGGGVSRYDGKTFTNYTTAHGLLSDVIWSIKEDKTGNIWFGDNTGGVSRYDGKAFTTIKGSIWPQHKIILCIEEDKKGNMWFGTNGEGVFRYDGKVFTKYTMAQGLANNQVLSIMEDKMGSIWFGTGGGGVSRFDGKVFVNTNQEQGLANNWVLSILEDKKGNIWFGHDGAGASCYNGENYTYYTKDQGLAGSIIRCIAEDTKGNIWFGTDGGGVSRYDGESFANFNIENGLGNDAVFSIIEDKAGNLWFSTFGGGVSCYQGKSFTTFSTANGLSSGQVMCIAEDNAGSLWFGTYGGGASKYDGKSFTNYTPAQGLDNHLLCIEADKTGKLWFGSFKGFLTCYDGKSFTNYRSEQGLVSNTINSITVDQSNNIWLGTPRGLTRFNGESFTNYTAAQGLVNNSVHCVFADKKDRIWALTDKGISRSDSLLSADSLEVKFTNFTTANGLPGNVVYNMTEDKKGNFWLAGTAGLSRYDGQSFLNYSSSDGLMQDAITQVIQDKTGGIWVGTRANFGLGQLSFQKPAPLSRSGATKGELIPAGLLSTSNKELKNYDLVTDIYNAYTGYPLKAVSALFMDSKGIIWMATSSDKTALIRFDPSAINKNSNPRTVVIKSVKINEEKIGWYSLSQKNNKNQTDHSLAIINEEVTTFGKVLSDIERDKIYQKYTDIQYDSVSKWYPTPQNLVLPFDHNNITFDFVAIEPARNFLVRYQYMLEGYDKSWSPVTDKTSASFGNMHEGIYTFKLKAKSSFGIWGEPITYTFEVLPPWWRTWWMYVFYILAVISTVVLIVRWNSRKLIAQRNRLKEKITRATTQIRQEKIKIEEANIHITEQKKVVEEKNKDILDSIHYAKRIQNALLRKEEYFVKHLPEHFVLFMPKDIVSGDFYWALRRGFSLPTEEEASKKYWYVAAVDCTGHGVPGAFMSMLGMSFLNEIANGDILHTPAKILNELRTKVIKELGQTGKMENSKDGMDISLIRWHLETNEIQWAGANNPLFLVRNGELQKIKGDKQPIGYYPESKPFTNHTLQLQEGDCIYIFTDGYADQFGGPKGKKLMYKQLEQLILTNCHLSMDNQKRILKKTFMEWKGELDQIDDVCIIGIKI